MVQLCISASRQGGYDSREHKGEEMLSRDEWEQKANGMCEGLNG